MKHIRIKHFQTAGSDPETIHYVKNVLRMHCGEKIRLYDGHGFDCICKIADIKKDKIAFEILEKALPFPKPIPLRLAHALVKSPLAMDSIIQKSVELGVSEIHLLKTERSIPRFTDWESKKKRFERIIDGACNQCKRTNVPLIFYHPTLADFFNHVSGSDFILLDPTASDFLKPNHSATLLIGPEGGWSPEEIELTKEKKIQRASIGKTILRTETASLYALIACHYMLSSSK